MLVRVPVLLGLGQGLSQEWLHTRLWPHGTHWLLPHNLPTNILTTLTALPPRS